MCLYQILGHLKTIDFPFGTRKFEEIYAADARKSIPMAG